MNPLFPHQDDNQAQPGKGTGYVLDRGQTRTIQPLSAPDSYREDGTQQDHAPNPAANLIRQKIDALYAAEPDAKQEIAEVEQVTPKERSKHQAFMHQLTASGKSLAQIQTEWHDYYTHLPDAEKHEVWQEFYEANSRTPSAYTQAVTQQPAQPQLGASPGTTPSEKQLPAVVSEHLLQPTLPTLPHKDRRTTGDIKKQLQRSVSGQEKKQSKAKQHLHSLMFGVGTGVIVLVITMFSFFNEMIIAPFIQPSRHVSATPIILSGDSVAPSETPEVIIPKINVQIPVVYDNKDIAEASIQDSLEDGVVHYPTTVQPGQKGNSAIFGHSSNNIFNKGKYKFAFVLLHELVPGDTFYLTQNGKVYSYKVFKKQVVKPTETWVLGSVPDKTATATLITCDPPGTTTNRLVVWGEQISPDPATGATEPAAGTPINSQPTELPSDGPSLWKRLTGWLF